MNKERAFGIGFIFWFGPKSDTLEGLIDLLPLPVELTVFASSPSIENKI
jgi:hypothetical protein